MVAVVAAACLHASVLWHGTTSASAETRDSALDARPIQVRLLAASERPSDAPALPIATQAAAVPSPVTPVAPVQHPPAAGSDGPARSQDASPARSPVASPPSAQGAAPALPADPGMAAPSAAAASAPAGLPPAPDYALASGLDPGPQRLNDVEPDYPERAGMRSGAVVVRILVADTGAIDDVGIVRSTPEGLFDAAALAAVRATRFAPGRRLGIAVKSQLTVEIAFTPVDRGARVSGRGY